MIINNSNNRRIMTRLRLLLDPPFPYQTQTPTPPRFSTFHDWTFLILLTFQYSILLTLMYYNSDKSWSETLECRSVSLIFLFFDDRKTYNFVKVSVSYFSFSPPYCFCIRETRNPSLKKKKKILMKVTTKYKECP